MVETEGLDEGGEDLLEGFLDRRVEVDVGGEDPVTREGTKEGKSVFDCSFSQAPEAEELALTRPGTQGSSSSMRTAARHVAARPPARPASPA